MANKDKWEPASFKLEQSKVRKRNIRSVMPLKWEEHCVECAMPACYTTCSLYNRRRDGDCARFVYGIVPDKQFKGCYNYGADIRFRKWGKLEASLAESFSIPFLYGHSISIHEWVPSIIKRFMHLMARKRDTERKLLFDEFILECYSPEKDTFPY